MNEHDRIAVCVGVKNRSQSLLDNLVASMERCSERERLVLSVIDCRSTDVTDLPGAIGEAWSGEVVFGSMDAPFARTATLNAAVRQAPAEKVFVCDSDMTLPPDFVKQYEWHVTDRTAWFPICFDLRENRPRLISEECGTWRKEGYGMVGILKRVFDELGGLDERFVAWGKEDYDLFVRARKTLLIKRYECRGLFHNWHPVGSWRSGEA